MQAITTTNVDEIKFYIESPITYHWFFHSVAGLRMYPELYKTLKDNPEVADMLCERMYFYRNSIGSIFRGVISCKQSEKPQFIDETVL